jgi:hypothetical protein
MLNAATRPTCHSERMSFRVIMRRGDATTARKPCGIVPGATGAWWPGGAGAASPFPGRLQKQQVSFRAAARNLGRTNKPASGILIMPAGKTRRERVIPPRPAHRARTRGAGGGVGGFSPHEECFARIPHQSGSDLRRGGDVNSGSVPPRRASRRALSRSTSATRASRTNAETLVSPVRARASATISSSRIKVARILTHLHGMNGFPDSRARIAWRGSDPDAISHPAMPQQVINGVVKSWRKGRDSNPRDGITAYAISSRAH